MSKRRGQGEGSLYQRKDGRWAATPASLLLAQGVHPRVVMEMLGHSTIALTMNTYSHVIPALERDAADRMNAALTVSGILGGQPESCVERKADQSGTKDCRSDDPPRPPQIERGEGRRKEHGAKDASHRHGHEKQSGCSDESHDPGRDSIK